MNSPSSSAQLATLSRRSPDDPATAASARKRLPAWLLPVAILAGFAALFLALFGDRILPAPHVQVAAALATPGDSSKVADAPAASSGPPGPAYDDKASALFQASGWIEPSPLPIKATALIDGVVATVDALEGQSVRKGDLLATLISDDARLELASAEQRQRTLTSTYQAHLAAIVAAKKKLAGLEAQTLAAATLRDEAADRLKRVAQLPRGAVSESDVVTARLRVNREESQHLAAASSAEEAKAEIARLEAESQVRQDEIQAAAVEVDKAKLMLERTRIPSPADGRILKLLAAPGQKKMLADQDPESSTIAILYQPGQIQVRVDVPLADAAGLLPGQPVRIRCGLLPDRIFHGEVTRLSGSADLQRNTLQAKVSITDPVDQLRPDMLCRVEFLPATIPSSPSGGGSPAAKPASGDLATWIPQAAIAGDAAWVCDPETRRVERRAVKTRGPAKDGYVCLEGGAIRPGEWVILSPPSLKKGQLVNPSLLEK